MGDSGSHDGTATQLGEALERWKSVDARAHKAERALAAALAGRRRSLSADEVGEVEHLRAMAQAQLDVCYEFCLAHLT